ncbi:MAG: PAS domain S-box protein [Sphingobacteriia bacterium]|nr:PAS domain S-box protein [Sphingobacteriia bacterium]
MWLILTFAFILLMVSTASTIGILAYQSGQAALTTLARQLTSEIGHRVDQQLAHSVSDIDQVVRGNADLIRQGLLDWRDPAELARHFAGQLRMSPSADGIALLSERHASVILERAGSSELILRRFDTANEPRLSRYRADLDGQVLQLIDSDHHYDPRNHPPDQPHYPIFRQAEQGHWRVLASLAEGQERPRLIVTFGLPFSDDSGAVQGVLLASMSLSRISTFLRAMEVGRNGQTFLIDREGMLVASSTGEIPIDTHALSAVGPDDAVKQRRLSARASSDPLTRAAAHSLLALGPTLTWLVQPRVFEFTAMGEGYLAEALPLSRTNSHPDWITIVVAPRRDFTALIAAQRDSLILFSALVMLSTILLGLGAASLISRPLRDLTTASCQIANGDFDHPMPATPIQELRRLGAAFVTMSQRLHAAFADLRQAERLLAEHNRDLEQRVAERTTELIGARAQVETVMAQLTISEAKFRGMFEQSPAGIALIEPASGRLLEANEQLLEIIGRTRAELIAQGASLLLPDTDPLPESADWVRRLVAERATAQLEQRYLHPDGTEVWGHLRVSVLAIGAAADPLQLWLIDDITARKRAESRLTASERKLRTILDNLPIPIGTMSLMPERPVTYVNEQFVHTLGYRLTDIDDESTWMRLAYPDPLYRRRVNAWWERAVRRAIKTTGKVEPREFRVTGKDGRVFNLLISATVLEDILLAVFIDITQRKRDEAELRQAHAAAESANATKSAFLAQMTHELRTPLHAILGFTQVLDTLLEEHAVSCQDENDSFRTRRNEMLRAIQRNGRLLMTLINDALDLSSLEHGGLVLEIGPTDLHRLLSDCIANFSTLAASRGLTLQLQQTADLPAGVWLDGRRLTQILGNLLGNAIKFTEQGTVRLRAEAIPHSGLPRQVTLQFSVTDTGRGIPPASQATIFEPFVQVTGRHAEGQPKGTGLGLAISRQLVQRMGGRLDFESQEGVGSRFTVVLPAVAMAKTPSEGGGSRSLCEVPPPVAESVSSKSAPPPAEALRELRELAELGRTMRLEAWCQHWGAPARHPELAARVLALTLAFEHGRILDLVDECLAEQGRTLADDAANAMNQ